MNYKNQLIIFSKNRASQLHCLLNSIYINGKELFDTITVLYKSDEEYKTSYDILIKEFINIKFYEEYNFKNNLLKLIDDNIELTTFMVDDLIVYEKIITNKSKIFNLVLNENNIFSLRLGSNCNYSHPANISYKLKEHQIKEEFIVFDYTKQEIGDFRYPLSTDGHIFKTELIKELLIEIEFNNPNTLESNLQRYLFTDRVPKYVSCFITSKVVSIPVNLVNTTFNNRHGLEFGISIKELNNKFLNDEFIDLNSMDFSNINGPHKEIKYIFK